jgi:hypothetical protein
VSKPPARTPRLMGSSHSAAPSAPRKRRRPDEINQARGSGESTPDR